MTETQKKLRDQIWYDLVSNDHFDTLHLEGDFYESTGRYSFTIDCKGNLILSASISRYNIITLHRLEIPEHKQMKGIARSIIKVLTNASAYRGNRLIVKYPDNKEFWNYYSAKYGGIEFQYR
jgi:hypothetical protein